jgi:hypothetical protein
MRRNRVIFIRCTEDTYRDFRVFVADRGFTNTEDALKFLVSEAKRLDLRPGRSYL